MMDCFHSVRNDWPDFEGWGFCHSGSRNGSAQCSWLWLFRTSLSRGIEIELSKRKIPYTPQKQLPIYYKGHRLKRAYVPDYIAFEMIVIEIKAISTLSSLEESQHLNYLKASNLEVGLLINSGANSLQWKQMVRSNPEKIRVISG